MSLTILEVLQNAEINLVTNPPNMVGQMLGKEQLSNALRLLENDYGLYEDFDKAWVKYKEAYPQ